MRLVTDIYRQLGADVMTPGIEELVDGRAVIDAMIAAAGTMPLVCTNLDPAAFPPIRPAVILEKGGRRVLVAAVIDPHKVERRAIHGLTVTDPVLALRRVLADMPHDLAVVVIHAADRTARRLLAEVAGFDIAILAAQRGLLDEVSRVGDTLLLKNNNHGKTVGWLDWPAAGPPGAAPAYVTAGTADITPDPDILQQVEVYEEWLRQHYIELETLAAAAPESPPRATYIGSTACARCHPETVAEWKTTAHARAYASLQQKCKDYCPDCLPCHVTGRKNPIGGTGFLSPAATPHLFDVQCEQCHGSGHRHIEHPEEPYGAEITPETCIECHTPYTDPEFSFADDLDLVDH
ncbi:MAG: hypothetical protein JW781_03095 [Deltaproteobacteria bacterium]|nr:hypothetical protein [Candidatus Anaeroferrophillacea bacterium]